MSSRDDIDTLRVANAALRKTVDALMRRVDGNLACSTSGHDVFARSVLLQKAVQRRTSDLEQINQSVRAEADRRRIAEESLQRERGLLMMVLANIPHLVYWKDCESVYCGCNPAFAQYAGLKSSRDVVGKTDANLPWSRQEADSCRRDDQDVMQSGSPWLHVEENRVAADGKEITLLTSKVPLRSDDGDMIGVLGICADITERKVLEAQLAQALKLESIGQLAAGIAHEINTPTQYVGDNVRFLKDAFVDLTRALTECRGIVEHSSGDADSRAETMQVLADIDCDFLTEEIPKAIDESLDGLQRVSTIVMAMKDFSHPGTHELEPVDLNKAIESTVIVCKNRWKYVADLDLDLEPTLPLVPCRMADLNQVVLNLIINAADAIGEKGSTDERHKGRIQVSTRECEGSVEIRVSDTGGGIPKEIVSRIFDPFFTTKEVGKGTGQGLAICRDVIVNRHEGELLLENKPGEGATFVIRLPVCRSDGDRAMTSREAA